MYINIENIQNFSVFENSFDFFIFSIGTILIFIRFFDDKYQISANLKFIIMLIISTSIIILGESLLIDKIAVTFFNSYELSKIQSIMWTLVCFLLFMNALNMFDGINYQVAIYSMFLSLFLYLTIIL